MDTNTQAQQTVRHLMYRLSATRRRAVVTRTLGYRRSPYLGEVIETVEVPRLQYDSRGRH